MSLYKVMGVEVEMDFLDVEFMEKFENAYDKMTHDYKDVTPVGKASDLIRQKCNVFKGFIIDLFGEDAHEKMFKGKISLDMYLTACDDIFNARVAQEMKYKQLNNKYNVKNGNFQRFQNGNKKKHHK